uniref:Uncharacterized protein n=3 Tax=Panagrolaimus TaxID=55784 RepID=A0A914PZL3_9BILA
MSNPKSVATTLNKCLGVKVIFNGSIFHADCDQRTLTALVNTWTIKMALNVVGITISPKAGGGYIVTKSGTPVGNLHAMNNIGF